LIERHIRVESPEVGPGIFELRIVRSPSCRIRLRIQVIHGQRIVFAIRLSVGRRKHRVRVIVDGNHCIDLLLKRRIDGGAVVSLSRSSLGLAAAAPWDQQKETERGCEGTGHVEGGAHFCTIGVS
jgi:hypothetical protein